MTAVEDTFTGRRRDNGVLTAARLSAVGARMRTGMPWLIIAAIGLVTVVLALIPPRGADGEGNPGLLAAFFLLVAFSYLPSMTQTFPFALSLGVTRRNFSLGTGLMVLAETALHAVALTVLLVLERATGGWGLSLRLFDIGFLVQDGPLTQFASFFGVLVGLSFLVLLVGTVFQRWGQPGVLVAGIVLTLVVGGLAVLATWLRWWPALGAFLGDAPTLLLTAVFPLVVALVAGAGGYLLLRRATP